MDSDVWKRLVEATPHLEDRERSRFFQKVCGVKQPSVSRWRTGKNTPSLNNCIDISIATGFCVQWLYTGKGRKHTEPSDDLTDEILSILDSTDPDTRAEILNFARFHKQRQ